MSSIEALQELDLSKNEARIYETLVDLGEIGVAEIAQESGVNRRNVYDIMDRLQEKGLVFEIKRANESHFKAVHPSKLREILKEKEQKLEDVIPDLEYLYRENPHDNEVYIYQGIEGWKNYLQDILRVEKDLYTIGGKGAWTDDKLQPFLDHFTQQVDKKNIEIQILFDAEVKEEKRDILEKIDSKHRFLPSDASTPSSVDIFGDYVVIFSGLEEGKIDEDTSFTVIKNPEIATSFRTWFRFVWASAEEK
ncbi:MAG: hypothetical protein BRC25_02695 [Parcubacteria group bacterium SW_6_46_9]|nr:MAG: hypothetical protein BRC25_02695 [Parcubacteria group bacterium SW_6_46_9]